MSELLSLLEIVKRTGAFLASKGVENSRLNAELLIAHALGCGRMDLYLQFERPLTEEQLAKIRPLVKRRSQREPVQYIVGETDFFHLRLKTDRRALIPRPETEQLAERIVAATSVAPVRVLDLGTGSGALALGLAKAWPEARVLAVDASSDALVLARENAESLGLSDRVEFLQSDWFASVPSEMRFDWIVSNPPYLTAEEVAEAHDEVREHEPKNALIAADAGCADLLRIIERAGAFLAPGGRVALETGVAQHERLLAHGTACGFSEVSGENDLAGRPRFLFLAEFSKR